MSWSGTKLTEVEASLIENSLTILMSANKFQDIFFLGRLDTDVADRYYLAFGYKSDILKDRKYFYSLNGYEWFLMPNMKAKLMPIARQLRKYFHGDPTFIEKTQVDKDSQLLFLILKQILLFRVSRLFLMTTKFSFLVCKPLRRSKKKIVWLALFTCLWMSRQSFQEEFCIAKLTDV